MLQSFLFIFYLCLSELTGALVVLPACPGLHGLTSYVGTDCHTSKCSAMPPQYPGPLCVCKACPLEPIEATNEFDKELYQCLVYGLRFCPAPEKSRMSNSNASDTRPKLPPTPGSTVSTFSPANFTLSIYNFSEEATRRPTSSEDSNQWVGLTIGLGVLVIGSAALIGWFWREWKRRHEKSQEDNEAEERLQQEDQAGEVNEPEGQPCVTSNPQTLTYE